MGKFVASPSVDDARKGAFAALAAVASDFLDHGKRCFAASAKPALKARADDFDESALGYSTFRDFLLDAERHGAVDLAFVGEDFEIRPGNSSEKDAGGAVAVVAAPREKRIKRSFWNAVIDLRPDRSWLYDTRADRVVSDAYADRDGLVEIPKAGEEIQGGWIADFVGSLNGVAGGDVSARVASAPTIRDKLRAVATRQDTRGAWYETRTAHVAKMLESWKADNHLTVDLFETTRGSAPRRVPGNSTRQKQSADDALRTRLHRAIDQMPISELLRLSIPVEYIVER